MACDLNDYAIIEPVAHELARIMTPADVAQLKLLSKLWYLVLARIENGPPDTKFGKLIKYRFVENGTFHRFLVSPRGLVYDQYCSYFSSFSDRYCTFYIVGRGQYRRDRTCLSFPSVRVKVSPHSVTFLLYNYRNGLKVKYDGKKITIRNDYP